MSETLKRRCGAPAALVAAACLAALAACGGGAASGARTAAVPAAGVRLDASMRAAALDLRRRRSSFAVCERHRRAEAGCRGELAGTMFRPFRAMEHAARIH
jgi:hypothetical protein